MCVVHFKKCFNYYKVNKPILVISRRFDLFDAQEIYDVFVFVFLGGQFRDLETFELNQLNPPLHNFYRFFHDVTGCKLVAINLDRPIELSFNSAREFW
jgi:hypothetical protein